MSTTFSYPRVHVVGSGAYYAYRPITRYIERADRSYIRESSSRPKEFSQYAAVAASRGDGFVRAPSSDPAHLDAGRDRKGIRDRGDDFFKHAEDDSFFRSSRGTSKLRRSSLDESLLKTDDPFFKHPRSHLHSKHNTEVEDSHSKQMKEHTSSLFKKTADESIVERADRDALFGRTDDALTKLRRKHPYRLPVESEFVPPHESSIWPENRPHFDLVSSYDTMVDFLGIREKSKN